MCVPEGILDATCRSEDNYCTFFLFIYLIISYKLPGLNSHKIIVKASKQYEFSKENLIVENKVYFDFATVSIIVSYFVNVDNSSWEKESFIQWPDKYTF